MTLPHPGAPKIDNVIATLLRHGNHAHSLDLDRIASFQGFEPDEFRARFAKLETAFSLTPKNCEVIDGK